MLPLLQQMRVGSTPYSLLSKGPYTISMPRRRLERSTRLTARLPILLVLLPSLSRWSSLSARQWVQREEQSRSNVHGSRLGPPRPGNDSDHRRVRLISTSPLSPFLASDGWSGLFADRYTFSRLSPRSVETIAKARGISMSQVALAWSLA